MLVSQEDEFRTASPYGAEFHQRLIVASGVETDRHVRGPLWVDEKQAAEQHILRMECATGTTVRIYVGEAVGQPQLQLLQGTPPFRGASRRNGLSTSCHRCSSSEQIDVGVLNRYFIGLQQIRQYDVSCQ